MFLMSILGDRKMASFKIFDVHASLLSDYPIVEAKNSKLAVYQYLRNKGLDIKLSQLKNSASRFVQYSATKLPFGRQIWYILST
jgi:hypothetical protein